MHLLASQLPLNLDGEMVAATRGSAVREATGGEGGGSGGGLGGKSP